MPSAPPPEPAAAAPPGQLDITLAGFSLGSLTLSIEETGPHYEGAARFKTEGFAGVLNYTFDGTATGSVGATLRPVHFASTSHSPRALRHTRIDWEGSAPTLVEVNPPRDEMVDPATQAGALDPVTALGLLFRDQPAAKVCATSLKVFDGSRSVRLTLDGPVTSGTTITCAGDYVRLGGDPLTPIDPPECPFEIVYRLTPDGRAVFDHLRIPTRFGEALITRPA